MYFKISKLDYTYLHLDLSIQEWLTPHALENKLDENPAVNGAAGGRAAIEADDSTSMTDVTRECAYLEKKPCLRLCYVIASFE